MTSKHIGSVFSDEPHLLDAILKIHINQSTFDCDPMFNRGHFYRSMPTPKYISDISPVISGCKTMDATNLEYEDNQFQSMILDPPFVFGIHGKTREYFASQNYGIYENFKKLQESYKALLKEAYRVIDKKGILVFKCQDYTDSKTTMTHAHVWQWAQEAGFYPKDLAILHLSNKIANNKLTQRHLRKHHSYFWVFQA